MKRIIAALLMLLLLAACQPTPEKDAVRQKDSNVLIDTVLTEQQAQQERGEALPKVRDQVPDHFTADFYTPAKNVHVMVDAPIRVLTDDVFPVIRVERGKLKTEDAMLLAKRLLGSDKLYVWTYRMTREDLEREIAVYMHEPTPEEKAEWMRDDPENTEELWNENMETRRKELEALQEQYRNFTDGETQPFPEWDGTMPEDSNPYFDSVTLVGDPYANGKSALYCDHFEWHGEDNDNWPFSYTAAVAPDANETLWPSVFGDKSNGEMGAERIAPDRWGEACDGASITAGKAAEIALSYMNGFGEFTVADIYWTNNSVSGGEGAFIPHTWAYGVRLTPKLHGAGTVFCKLQASENDPITDVSRGWEYSRVIAIVGGDGTLLGLGWSGVIREAEILSETTTLLPLEEIQTIFEEQINRQLAYEEMRDAVLSVDDVQLGLFRIREKNDMEHGLLVPVWFFRGTLTPAETSKWSGFIQYYDGAPIMIINAIDGSIIDPENGY